MNGYIELNQDKDEYFDFKYSEVCFLWKFMSKVVLELTNCDSDIMLLYY